MKFEIRHEEEAHEALAEILRFYSTHHRAPASLHLLADVLYLVFGEKDCVEALEVVSNALSEWKNPNINKGAK